MAKRRHFSREFKAKIASIGQITFKFFINKSIYSIRCGF